MDTSPIVLNYEKFISTQNCTGPMAYRAGPKSQDRNQEREFFREQNYNTQINLLPPLSKFFQGILKNWCRCQKKSKHPPSASGTEKQKQVVKQLSWQSFWPGAGRPGFRLGCRHSWLPRAQLYGNQSHLDKKCLWKTRHENTHFIVESTNSIIDIRKSAH